MMRFACIYTALALFLPAAMSVGQEKDSLAAFIEDNPNAVDFDVIYEGTKLNLSADEDNLLVNLSIAHPALQMRFLMQKVSLYIDPSGKKRKKYEVTLPSAIDVKDELEAAGSPSDALADPNVRPDIRPLISAMNRRGAVFRWENNADTLGYQRFHIEIDPASALLNLYVLLPKERLMHDRKLSDKWSLGIFSVNDFSNPPPPGGEGAEGMMPPPAEGENQQDIQELMQSDIRLWVRFSIDDVNNANLKSPAPDSLEVRALQCGDSIVVLLTVRPIETQLTFLMQGLHVTIAQPDTLVFTFPSAAMVKDKVRRHPNEVKAVLDSQRRQKNGQDSINQVVRPDVQPLVAALNDTTASICISGRRIPSRDYRIDVDRENAVMSFSFKVPDTCVSPARGYMNISLFSAPSGGSGRAEFSGKRLSGENAPLPQGLGEGLRKEDVSKRTFGKTFSVRIDRTYGR